MRRAFAWLLLMALAAATAHVATIAAMPYVAMSAARARLDADGGATGWAFAPRVTPQSQQVIRSAPDLAYAVCAFDVSDRPMRVAVAPGAGLMLLTLYADNTDAFFTLTERDIGPQGVELVIIRRGAPPPPGAGRVIVSPSARGLAIERRLAPDQAAFAEADQARRANVCAPV